MKLQRLAWAAMFAAGLTLAACGGGNDDDAETSADVEAAESAAAGTEGGDAAASTETPEPEAPAGFAGTWIEDDTDPDRIELLDGGVVRTNEPSLGEGRWEESNGGLVLTFQNGGIRITGQMEGDTLVLTAPNGETGRFNRSNGGDASGGGNSGGGNSGGQGGGGASGGGKPG